ncbi:MAG: transporter substrate-binding domain-containing protein [Candidatus Omnitrophota bacterium]
MRHKKLWFTHFPKIAINIVVILVVISVFYCCAMLNGDPSDGKRNSGKALSKLEKIKRSGKLVVGTSADYPPYEFHLFNESNGDLVGIDIDIAKAIARELGVKLVIRDLIFSRIFSALRSDQIDIAIAGLNPTAERKEFASFSDIYYQAIQSILIRTEDMGRIKTVEDLRGKKIGTQRDSIQEAMAHSEIQGARYDVRETIEELVILLEKGLVDAIILEEPVANSYIRQKKNFMKIRHKRFENLLGSAIAVKKGDYDLLKEINRILADLKKTDKITEYEENAKMLTNKR